MSKKRNLFLVALIIAVGIFFANPTPVPAMDAKLIKIQSDGLIASGANLTDINLKTVTIKEDTAVIWLNGINKDVKVVFEVPIACQDIYPDDNMNILGKRWKDCYTTTFLSFSDTGSLLFNKAGVFDYSVQTEDGQTVETGRIVVRTDSIAKNIQ